jgi:hypothetical protein
MYETHVWVMCPYDFLDIRFIYVQLGGQRGTNKAPRKLNDVVSAVFRCDVAVATKKFGGWQRAVVVQDFCSSLDFGAKRVHF